MIVQATSSPSSSAVIAQSPAPRNSSPAQPANTADTVTISATAHKTLSSSVISGSRTDEYPLEMYSIPKWQSDLMSVVLSGNLGKLENLYLKGGNLVGGKFDSELAEYGQLFDSHLKTILQSKGVTTAPEFHQAMIVDKESSENIRMLMKESIAGDNRMIELMKTLGVPLPS
jgi:hypothetical protein